MKDFKIVDMDLASDKEQINNWQTLYAGTDELKAIEHYILEDHMLYDLGEVVETNFEIVHIGDNEIKKALVAKTNEDEIVGFILCQAFDLQTNLPEIFLQYIVINPKYQHQGYGKAIFTEFFSHPQKYLGLAQNQNKPHNVFSFIDKTNVSSQALYKSFGFDLSKEMKNSMFVRATGTLPELEKIINQQSLS